MIPAELLRKKRDGMELSAAQIEFFVRGIVEGAITHPQAAAFLMAVCIRGLSKEETVALTTAMANCGMRFRWDHLGKTVDKHSTGGVGDKLSLLVAPLAACAGACIPMMSGRALGHTGGTIDKLESIVGFQVHLNPEHIEQQLRRIGVVMMAQSAQVAPADRILYALRDETGTVESDGLITASILSKKIAEGTQGLVLDVKVGKGAFMQNYSDARRLALLLDAVGREAGLSMHVVLTDMDDPLGHAVGNWVEVYEAEQCLTSIDKTPSDLRELVLYQTAALLLLSDIVPTLHDGQHVAEKHWRSGAAYERFHQMIQAQGGDWQASVQKFMDVPSYVVLSPDDGYVKGFATRQIGLVLVELGAGRLRQSDIVDPAAGAIFHVKRGDRVERGQPLITLYASQPSRLPLCAERILSTIELTQEKPSTRTSLVIESITPHKQKPAS